MAKIRHRVGMAGKVSDVYQLLSPDAFLAHCSTRWALFMTSIKTCNESGRGHPDPDDVTVDPD